MLDEGDVGRFVGGGGGGGGQVEEEVVVTEHVARRRVVAVQFLDHLNQPSPVSTRNDHLQHSVSSPLRAYRSLLYYTTDLKKRRENDF